MHPEAAVLGKGVDRRPQRLLRSSVRRAPHPEPSLPGHLMDQTACFHPSKVALNGGAAGFGHRLGHWGRDERPFGQYGTQGRWRLARELGHFGFCPSRPCFDCVEVPHRGQTCSLHPDKPPRQTVNRRTARTQPPCPAHSHWRKDRSFTLAGGDPCGCHRRLYPVALLPEPR